MNSVHTTKKERTGDALFSVEALKGVDVNEWKNIPVPLCATIKLLMNCVHDMKRFVINQQYTQQITTSQITKNSQQSENIVYKCEQKFKEQLDLIPGLIESEIEANEKKMNKIFIETEEALMLKVNTTVDEKLFERTQILKSEFMQVITE